MKKCVGIWINNRKAVIVSLEKGQEQHETVESHAIRHIRLPGEPKGMSQPEKADQKYQEELRQYFREVLETIRGAQEIFICRPGMAKEQLQKALLASGEPSNKVIAVEPADKMTDNQIIARTREFFHPKMAAEHGM